MPGQALSDLKVIEYGHFIAGPCCAKLLADLRADVIKVAEPTGSVDDIEAKSPLKAGGNQSGFVTAFAAAMGTMWGIFYRKANGEGILVDVSEHETIAALLRRNLPRGDHVHEDAGWSKTIRTVGGGGILPTKDGVSIA